LTQIRAECCYGCGILVRNYGYILALVRYLHKTLTTATVERGAAAFLRVCNCMKHKDCTFLDIQVRRYLDK